MICPYGLIADIGGTNARFALADDKGYYEEKILKCREFHGPQEAVEAYFAAVKLKEPVRFGAFAIAGPVHGDVFAATNMPWNFSIRDLRDTLGFEHLYLYNDFEAVAMCVPHLKEGDIRQVGGGQAKARKPVGVIGPGTGLGTVCLFHDGNRYCVVPGEGGHVTAPVATRRE